jgi:hypothetical protein
VTCNDDGGHDWRRPCKWNRTTNAFWFW